MADREKDNTNPVRERLVSLLLQWDSSKYPVFREMDAKEAGELVDEFLLEYPIYAQAHVAAELVNNMAATCAGILGDAGHYLEAIGSIPKGVKNG